MNESLYLSRYAWNEPLFPEYIPDPNLGIIVVIPSFKETDIQLALDSINACEKPKSEVLILVLVNESEDEMEEVSQVNKETVQLLNSYESKFKLIYAYKKLPHKKAGVGLARKIGMDEAVRFFEQIDTDGIIACYDADCACDPTYLKAIEQAFSNTQTNAGIVFYEHQLTGSNNEQIIKYETYLRYYIDALRFAGYPFAHQTLGSCIVVRSSMYQSQVGMNTRKAGEDFYFLNKVIPQGGFVEINNTTVYPSDRISDRVPFGTGKAIDGLIHSNESYKVYNPQTFEDLKDFMDHLDEYWKGDYSSLPQSIDHFLNGTTASEIEDLKNQTSSMEAFHKRFFRWFDAFKILKYVHFVRDKYFEEVELREAILWLNDIHPGIVADNPETQLDRLRDLDRKGFKPNRTYP